MTWTEAGQLCSEQLPLIARPLPPGYWEGRADFSSRCEFLFAEHARTQTAVDSAIAGFVATGGWPALPPGSLNWLVSLRLLCALDTLHLLRDTGAPPGLARGENAGSRAPVLNWLLRDSWHEWRWDAYLKLSVLRSLHPGPDAFYGLPPNDPPDSFSA